jgi:hypothetical protein
VKINKTNQSAVVQDLNGKLYFVDVTKKEYFIGDLTSSNINILPNAMGAVWDEEPFFFCLSIFI